MSNKPSQDVDKELAFQASQASRTASVPRTPDHVVQRYREHRHWRIDSKEFLFHHVHRHQPIRICDFGCGSGETSSELALLGYHVTGFDISPELIAQARQRARTDGVEHQTQFFVANAHELELQNESFDLVLVQAVLHHIDLPIGLKTLHALLKPGGIALIREPVAFSAFLQTLRDWTPIAKEISPNERQLNRKDLKTIESVFQVLGKQHFYLFARLIRVIPERWELVHRWTARCLKWVDYWAIRFVPGAGHFAGVVVLVVRRRKS